MFNTIFFSLKFILQLEINSLFATLWYIIQIFENVGNLFDGFPIDKANAELIFKWDHKLSFYFYKLFISDNFFFFQYTFFNVSFCFIAKITSVQFLPLCNKNLHQVPNSSIFIIQIKTAVTWLTSIVISRLKKQIIDKIMNNLHVANLVLKCFYIFVQSLSRDELAYVEAAS